MRRSQPIWIGGLGALWLLGCSAHAPAPSPSESPEASIAAHIEARQAEAVATLVEGLAAKATADASRRELSILGADAAPLLAPYLADPRMKVRWEVVSLLGASPDPRALLPLADRVLHDENPHVRWRSIWALGRFEDPGPAVGRFLMVLRTGASGERWNAAVALSVFERAEGLPLLHAAAVQLDGWYRWEAINALGRVHDEETPKVLEEVLESPVVRERAEAALVLGKIGTERAFELLLAALDDPAPGVRWRACLGLGRIADPRATVRLRELLAGETDSRVLEHGRDALEKIENRARRSDRQALGAAQ